MLINQYLDSDGDINKIVGSMEYDIGREKSLPI